VATVEEILQANNFPEYTKNELLYLKKGIIELSTTPATPAHDEILKRLSAVEKKLSAPASLPPKPLTYADSACLAMHLRTQDKYVPSRALKEVLVKVIGDPKLTQTSGRLVE
jgi:hypothetical protein